MGNIQSVNSHPKKSDSKNNSSGQSTGKIPQKTLNTIIQEETTEYLKNLTNIPSPKQVELALLEKVNKAIEQENADNREPGNKLRKISALNFAQIADILVHFHTIIRINSAGKNADSDTDLLAVYQTEGEDKGIYSTSEDTFRKLARLYNYSLTQKDFNETMIALRDKIPRKAPNSDKDLIAVNNGIFNYKTKTLQDFTPDCVFLTKSHVNYNPSATNVIIHNNVDNSDWDVESWLQSLSDDAEVTHLLWEILGAIVRPHVPWNKSAWFYSETGNNGKGTLCELMRNLCGDKAYASIPISDFGKEFMLEPLTRASAIIVDENDVGTFIDKAANLKAVITNDVIQINRKFKTPIAYRFHGFMVQCLNEFPRIRDKSDSFYRRQLFVPFEKNFKGIERKYIKNDYLRRPEVLEYVLFKILNMNYYNLSEPTVCKLVLDEFKEVNDPVRLFANEILPQCVWDLLPFSFLYDLYTAWFKKNVPSGTIISKTTFINDLLNTIKDGNEWICKDRSTTIKSSHKMDAPERLIYTYQLKDWYHPYYKGNDIDKLCTIIPASVYRGISRI